ncbi:hypothetical protein NSK_002908 [Nannochloropsis salina CCMP1776]|jgi:hypothetical protein|uniref:Uncharacterized protein n=1 Tax=Nannochloropsis salina CCMP1776 TaxID=1027361 RepID=A0A4D9DBT2_9STRA|nr:hypothetical protein NSK_002908 [Nannochloropsis salina CCMP1776]|eukprot:TFJ86088.1 hypothetical protein NSK_002908 [Nannochloropsis salina CCMP1776]
MEHPDDHFVEEEETMADIQAESIFLKDQLQRCLKELKLYQNIQSGRNRAHMDRAWLRSSAEALPDFPEWNLDVAAMTPLIAAYDGRIEELEHLNGLQAEKLASLAGKAEVLALENEDLHRAAFARAEQSCSCEVQPCLTEDNEESDRESNRESTEGDDAATESTLQHTIKDRGESELALRSSHLRGDNAALVKEVKIATLELREAKRSLLEKDLFIDTLHRELAEVCDASRGLRGDDTPTEKSRNSEDPAALTHAHLRDVRASLMAAVRKIRSLEQNLREAKESLSSREATWSEERNHLESRYEEAEQLSRTLQAQVETLTEESTRVRSQLESMERTQVELKEVREALGSTQRDATDMVGVMEELQAQVEGLQAQVKDSTSREKEVKELEMQCRVQVEEAMRQLATAREGEAQARMELHRLQEIQTVKVADLGAGTEQGKDRRNTKLLEQYERQREELKEGAEHQARLRAELEQEGLERRRTDRLYAELCTVVKSEQGGVREQVLELTRRLTESHMARGTAEAESARLAEELRARLSDAAARDRKWAEARRRLETGIRARDEELAATREKLANVEATLGEKVRQMARLERRQQEAETTWRLQVDKLQDKIREHVKNSKLKLSKAESVLREQEPVMSDFQARQGRILQRVRREYKDVIKEMHRSVGEEREAAQRISRDNKILLSNLASTSQELEASRDQLASLREDLQTSTLQVSELSSQLSESLRSQQLLVQEEIRLRAKLNGKNKSKNSVRRNEDKEHSSRVDALSKMASAHCAVSLCH